MSQKNAETIEAVVEESKNSETIEAVVKEPETQQVNVDPNAERQKLEDAMESTELDRLLDSANTTKLEANQKFAEGEYTKALELYDEALKTAPLKFKKERAIILSNCSAANIKLEKWELAVENATESIELGNPNEKSLERRGFAYSQKDDTLDKAIEDYKKLYGEFPTRHQYGRNIADLERRLHERNEKMKKEVMDQLKSLGNMCLSPFGLSTENFQMVEQPGGGYSIQMKK